jgi:ketopantoate hydroxymethyltransferase
MSAFSYFATICIFEKVAYGNMQKNLIATLLPNSVPIMGKYGLLPKNLGRILNYEKTRIEMEKQYFVKIERVIFLTLLFLQ